MSVRIRRIRSGAEIAVTAAFRSMIVVRLPIDSDITSILSGPNSSLFSSALLNWRYDKRHVVTITEKALINQCLLVYRTIERE